MTSWNIDSTFKVYHDIFKRLFWVCMVYQVAMMIFGIIRRNYAQKDFVISQKLVKVDMNIWFEDQLFTLETTIVLLSSYIDHEYKEWPSRIQQLHYISIDVDFTYEPENLKATFYWGYFCRWPYTRMVWIIDWKSSNIIY